MAAACILMAYVATLIKSNDGETTMKNILKKSMLASISVLALGVSALQGMQEHKVLTIYPEFMGKTSDFGIRDIIINEGELCSIDQDYLREAILFMKKSNAVHKKTIQIKHFGATKRNCFVRPIVPTTSLLLDHDLRVAIEQDKNIRITDKNQYPRYNLELFRKPLSFVKCLSIVSSKKVTFDYGEKAEKNEVIIGLMEKKNGRKQLAVWKLPIEQEVHQKALLNQGKNKEKFVDVLFKTQQ